MAPLRRNTGPGWRRVGAVIADAGLWLAAVLGSGAIVIMVAGLLFGLHPLIFRSGSMSPTITAGSLGLAHRVPAAEVAVGDIVTVPSGSIRVTHRVVSTRPVGDEVELTLRGDANGRVDADPYRVRTVDRLLIAVPGAGYVISWLSRPPGVFVLAGYAAVLLAVIIGRRPVRADRHDRRDDPDDPDDPGDHRRSTGPAAGPAEARDRVAGTAPRRAAGELIRVVAARPTRAAAGALLLGVTAAVSPSASWAAFTDTVPIAGSTMKTPTIAPTTLSCGAVDVLSVTFTWTAVPGATTYTLHYGINGAQQITVDQTSYTFVTAISGGTAWVVVNFGTGNWNSTISNKRSYTVAVVSLCN